MLSLMVRLLSLHRFEDIASSNGLQDDDDEEEDDSQPSESDGIVRSIRKKKKAPREHVRTMTSCLALFLSHFLRSPITKWPK